MNQPTSDIRWKQRFINFEKAFKKFKQALDAHFAEPDNELIQMALVQAFEFNFELSWKTMKDYLQYSGIKLNPIVPRVIFKEAFQATIIPDGQIWIDMMKDRNMMNHTYNEDIAKLAIERITSKYLEPIEQLYNYFKELD